MSRTSLIAFTLLLSLLSGRLPAEDWIYRLHRGDTLTLVAERFLKPRFTAAQLQVYNGILKDREIPVGTEIRVPIDWLSQALAGVEVRYVFGQAQLYRRGRDSPESLARGSVLKAGDRIVTEARSAVSLNFADGTHLLIGPSSEVVFDALSLFQGQGMLDTRIRLQRGRLENRVEPLQRPDDRYEILTPSAVTLVRGTDFRVSVEAGSELTRSEVTEGGVAVSAAGETVKVAAGEGTLIEQGKPPAPPRRLLSPPDLSALPSRQSQPMDVMRWPALAQAVSYRVQLLNDEASVVFAERVGQPQISLPEQPAGRYTLQVRGIDALGLEGLSARHVLALEAVAPRQSAPPSHAAPQLNQPRFAGPWLGVHWQPVAGAWAHRLILARDPALKQVVLEQLGQSSGGWLPLPPPGRYYLAVEALFDTAPDTTRSRLYRIEIPGWR